LINENEQNVLLLVYSIIATVASRTDLLTKRKREKMAYQLYVTSYDDIVRWPRFVLEAYNLNESVQEF